MKQTEEKVKGGRKRTHLVKVYLNDAEYEKLCRDAEMFKRDKSKYLRLLIDWIEPVAIIEQITETCLSCIRCSTVFPIY